MEAPEGSLMPALTTGNCDAMDGPVVARAREALETQYVNHVLAWVRPEDEPEIRRAFEHAVSVRKLGPRARELADAHFFETLVRVHRASEGEPYTGIKPAGADLGPAIPAADRALETGLVKELVRLLTAAARAGVHRHFHAALRERNFAVDDLESGRRYVAAYVSYIHYVERLWEAATGPSHGHHDGRGEHEPIQGSAGHFN